MKLIAHRGASGDMPENTLEAVNYSISAGFSGAELDVRLTVDGRLVLHHDPKLNPQYCRVVNGGWLDENSSNLISEMTYQELLNYDIGTAKPDTPYAALTHTRYPVTKTIGIPLLEDIFKLVKNTSEDFMLVLEIKNPVLSADKEAWLPLVDTLIKLIRLHSLDNQVVICSFDWRILHYINTSAINIRCWYTLHPLAWLGIKSKDKFTPIAKKGYATKLQEIVKGRVIDWWAGYTYNGNFEIYELVRHIKQCGGSGLFLYNSDLSEQVLLACKAQNLDVAVWSSFLNDPEEILRLTEIQPDYFCTDYRG